MSGPVGACRPSRRPRASSRKPGHGLWRRTRSSWSYMGRRATWVVVFSSASCGNAPELRGPRECVIVEGSALAAYRERPHAQSHLAQYPQVTLGKHRSDADRPRHRVGRFAGIYLAALFPGSRNGLLWIRDRMVRGMDGEAKADESISRHDVWGDGPLGSFASILLCTRGVRFTLTNGHRQVDRSRPKGAAISGCRGPRSSCSSGPGRLLIGSLGTIAMPSSVADRIAFWNRLHEQLAAGSAASDEPGRMQPSCLSGQCRRE